MAFRKKSYHIIDLQPDILIVPECEHPDKLMDVKIEPANTLWYGINKNKGLAVFSFGDYKLSPMDIHNPDFKLICPILVTRGEDEFVLIAVWANNPQDRDNQYIGQVWKAVNYYGNLLTMAKVIIAGDFNSNTIWDKNHRTGSHTMMVNKLAEMNIHSAYHQHHVQVQGKELHPTFHLYRHHSKPYHIDYCFASRYFLNRLAEVQVGTHHDWSHCSDHTPLIVTFND